MVSGNFVLSPLTLSVVSRVAEQNKKVKFILLDKTDDWSVAERKFAKLTTTRKLIYKNKLFLWRSFCAGVLNFNLYYTWTFHYF